MNKELLLSWILQDVEQNSHNYRLDTDREDKPDDVLIEELRSLARRRVELPQSIPSIPEQAIPVLRSHFKDNVTLVSRVLNHLFPDQYLFYRVSKLEEEIFLAFDFFSSTVPDFEFSFSRIGMTGFDRYLAVNEALMPFFRDIYSDLEGDELHARIAWFLYQGLGYLFLEKSDYHRYWVMATREEWFESLDSEDELTWSAHKGMQIGDLVFMYRTSPRSAITDVFEVANEPYFDPWGEWNGFWVGLTRVCQIEDIPFSDLKNDRVLGHWNVVRKRFQGVVVEPLPHSVYNRLLEKIPEDLRTLHDLEPEPTADEGRSGQFDSEADFEDQVIEPLLRRWGFSYQRQYRCRLRLGREAHYGLVDFYVSDGRGPITLFENKLRILNEDDLGQAVEQGKSYALLLGLPCFVVASPEGMRIYSLQRHAETLEQHISLDELNVKEEDVRRLLMRLGAA